MAEVWDSGSWVTSLFLTLDARSTGAQVACYAWMNSTKDDFRKYYCVTVLSINNGMAQKIADDKPGLVFMNDSLFAKLRNCLDKSKVISKRNRAYLKCRGTVAEEIIDTLINGRNRSGQPYAFEKDNWSPLAVGTPSGLIYRNLLNKDVEIRFGEKTGWFIGLVGLHENAHCAQIDGESHCQFLIGPSYDTETLLIFDEDN